MDEPPAGAAQTSKQRFAWKPIAASLSWLTAVVVTSCYRPALISRMNVVGWLYAITGFGWIVNLLPFKKGWLEEHEAMTLLRAMSLLLAYHLTSLLPIKLPARYSFLILQIMVTTAFAAVSSRFLRFQARAEPNPPTRSTTAIRQVSALIIFLMVLFLWVGIAQTLYYCIFAPARIPLPNWFTSHREASAFGSAIALTIISSSVAPLLLLVFDSVGWLVAPLYFLTGVFMFRGMH